MNLMKTLKELPPGSMISIEDKDAKRQSIRAECSVLKKKYGMRFMYMYVKPLKYTIIQKSI